MSLTSICGTRLWTRAKNGAKTLLGVHLLRTHEQSNTRYIHKDTQEAAVTRTPIIRSNFTFCFILFSTDNRRQAG